MEMVETALRVFLAIVFAASAIAKLRRDWSSELTAYGLWSPKFARTAAHVVVVAELVVVPALIFLPTAGPFFAGVTLLGFGHVQLLARGAGYDGGCGCSARGRVLSLTAARAYMWGALALMIGMEVPSKPSLIVGAGSAIVFGVTWAVVIASIVLWPGARTIHFRPMSQGG